MLYTMTYQEGWWGQRSLQREVMVEKCKLSIKLQRESDSRQNENAFSTLKQKQVILRGIMDDDLKLVYEFILRSKL